MSEAEFQASRHSVLFGLANGCEAARPFGGQGPTTMTGDACTLVVSPEFCPTDGPHREWQ